MRCREGIFQELHGKTGPSESKPRRRASLNSGGAPGASSGSQSDPIRISTPAPPPRLHLNTPGSEKTRRWRRPRRQTLTQQSNQAMVDGTVALSSTSEVKRDFLNLMFSFTLHRKHPLLYLLSSLIGIMGNSSSYLMKSDVFVRGRMHKLDSRFFHFSPFASGKSIRCSFYLSSSSSAVN